MATKPLVKATSATVNAVQKAVNAIYWNANENYQRDIPSIGDENGKIVDSSVTTLRSIGNAMMDYAPHRNTFVSALYNRIITVIVTSKAYANPWSFLKRGKLELGETIEEVFIGLADPHDFNPEKAEQEVFKREKPNVMSAFHSMNYQKFYKATTSRDELRQAFLSWENLVSFTERIIGKLYDSMEMDENVMMRYMIAESALNGYLYPVAIPAVTTENMKEIASILRSMASNLTFMDNRFNLAHGDTYTNIDDLYLFMDTNFEAKFGVEVLSDAFNMDKATYLGHRVLINGFGNLYLDRLKKLTENIPEFVYPTDAQIDALNAIPVIGFDKDWFMIFDNLMEFGEIQNPEGLYWNHTLHAWKTFSSSPFANAFILTTVTPSVTSVTITPATASVYAGQTLVMTANVVTTGFADKSLVWTVTDSTGAEVDGAMNNGAFTVPTTSVSKETYTVTATSAYDPDVSGTATLTVL